MSEQQNEDLSWRNLVRMNVLEVADSLQVGTLSGQEGAEKLRQIADADIRELDETEIEIDFDAASEGISAGPLLAMGGLTGAGKVAPANPVEEALAKVQRLRDRNQGLQIVAETPGVADIDAYRDALEELRVALNAAHSAA